MNYFSLFSGIGGFERGIGPGHLCVGYSEIDKYAIQIYQAHYPEHKNYGDITKIKEKELPDFELLVGGFPCQSFSIAGKRRGFSDTRGTLFFDIARILSVKKPRLLLLENVKGLLSHDSGNTFQTIIATLTELGYDVQWQVLNSKNHGVPQNRERIIIVGHLRGTPRPQVFPFTDIGEEYDGQDKIQTSNTITTNYHKGVGGGRPFVKVGTYRTHKDGRGFREKKDGLSPTIPARAREDGSGQPVILQKSQDWREKGKLRKFEKTAPTLRANMGDNHPMIIQRGRGKNMGGVHAISPTVSAHSFQDNNHVVAVAERGRYDAKGKIRQTLEPRKDKLTNTLTSVEKDNRVYDGMSIRRLTPVECERLQGFPDNWTKRGMDTVEQGEYRMIPISDTQRYKTLGNAVTVNVIRDVCKRLLAK